MKILAIGRNYAEHIKELHNAVPEAPVIFSKPDSALLKNNKPFFIPDFSSDIHYETELIIQIDRLGKHISEKFAPRYYASVGIGVDFTARDLQQKQREKGLPWEIAKAFDGSAVISEFVPLTEFEKDIQSLEFTGVLNGIEVQRGNTADMIYSVNQIIAYVSKFFTLKIGDIIFTGTPQGVGKVSTGDHFEAFLEGKKMLDFQIK